MYTTLYVNVHIFVRVFDFDFELLILTFFFFEVRVPRTSLWSPSKGLIMLGVQWYPLDMVDT